MIGKTLGHYQITSQLGKGGMGEVFQAKDQVLGRDVAIKVLPAEFAKNTDRVARFQREARRLASLNHPNIAAIHGLDGPLWSPDGRELFYRNLESVLAVSAETVPIFKYGKPHVLFRGAYLSESVGAGVLPNWDIHPDGKRFLMMKEIPTAAEGPQRINVVLNWLEELKQRVPVK